MPWDGANVLLAKMSEGMKKSLLHMVICVTVESIWSVDESACL